MGENGELNAMVRGRRAAAGRWFVRGLLGIALVGLGVAGGIVWSEKRGSWWPAAPGVPESKKGTVLKGDGAMPELPARPPLDPGAAIASESEPVEVSITPEAVERAGIKTAFVRSDVITGTITVTVPGTVTSNAYRDTKVNALVGGIVRHVGVELGQPVTRGQVLAVVFSNELAEAQMKYLSMQAMYVADHQKLDRTEQLVSIGAASRQELEEVTATHHGHETELAAARQRLLLLGLTSAQIAGLRDASHVVSEVMVTAPSDGLVIVRNVNPGQVVTAGQELFTVTDLSTVWVIGDLYEKDFTSIRAGSEATISMPATSRETLRGPVTYIDPRVDAASRTAKVRVEVQNRGGDLRLGMYVSVSFQTTSGERRIAVPKSAVQMLGERAVVYVPAADGEGRFTERAIQLGPTIGERVEVLSGVKAGERVVTEGSFLLRAEAARTRSGG